MENKKITSIGGQAVIEGVMMRGPFKTAVAVRKPDGEIVTKITENKVKGGFRKIPILRGIFAFVNSMVIGINALMFSAQFYEDDGTPKDGENNTETEKEENIEDSSELSGFAMFITLVTSLALSIGLFIVLPNLIAGWLVPMNNEIAYVSGETVSAQEEVKETKTTKKSFLESIVVASAKYSGDRKIEAVLDPTEETKNEMEKDSATTKTEESNNHVLYNVVESVVKIVIFLGYLILVSQMKDIKRVFEYHGAEHKTIFCYENREELTPENVMKYQRFHPRCGTSFLLFVIVISIIIYSIVGRHPNLLINVLIRLALLPAIAGVSYEIIRFAGKHSDNKLISWLNKPGMMLQRLTTREPDASQIECAIVALKAVIPEDEKSDIW